MPRRTSSAAVAYSRLPEHHVSEKSRPPPPSRMHMPRLFRTTYLLVGAALLFFASSGYWLSTRLSHEVNSIRAKSGPASKHLVIASFKNQDVSWLDDVPSSWIPYRYFLDDPTPENNLSVPQNLGREAMAYLTYIVDHYDDLPDYMIFTHGHYRSWHQVEPLPWKIRALNLTALDRERYIALRCEDAMGCENRPYIDMWNTNWPGEWTLPYFWEAVLPDLPMPSTLSYKCCAQFAVTREAITAHPLQRWERLREPLLEDLEVLRKDTTWGAGPPEVDGWSVGTFWEKIWHALLSGEPNLCPSVDTCRQEYFSNAILCAGGTELTMQDQVLDDIACVSAFENVAPDDEPDWEEWYKPPSLYSQWARVHSSRSSEWRARDERLRDAERERDELHDEVAKKQKVLDFREQKIKKLENQLKQHHA